MRQVRNSVAMPVMADESLHSLSDAVRLIKEEACDLFNIKLMKTGGLATAKKISSIAEAAGVDCMLGCMSETKVGITAATHLALAVKNIIYADLDGHLMLTDDIVTGGVNTVMGVNRLTAGVGLGISDINWQYRSPLQ